MQETAEGRMATATFMVRGELSAFIERGRRGRSFAYACARTATLKHAIEALGIPHTEAGRLMVNGQPATLSRIVREGDHVEVLPWGEVDEAPGGMPRFIADAHLGGLARLLRMLGFDTLYENAIHDEEIVALAGAEHRIVLTRDRELLKRRDVLRGCFVHALKPEAQLREVARRYALERHRHPFTLCLHCNLPLQPVDKRNVTALVPERIFTNYADFMRCRGCARVYWQGSHWSRMRDTLGKALATDPA
jgi:uncharacterized protein